MVHQSDLSSRNENSLALSSRIRFSGCTIASFSVPPTRTLAPTRYRQSRATTSGIRWTGQPVRNQRLGERILITPPPGLNCEAADDGQVRALAVGEIAERVVARYRQAVLVPVPGVDQAEEDLGLEVRRHHFVDLSLACSASAQSAAQLRLALLPLLRGLHLPCIQLRRADEERESRD
jgi:hypothetical protein